MLTVWTTSTIDPMAGWRVAVSWQEHIIHPDERTDRQLGRFDGIADRVIRLVLSHSVT